MWFGLHAARRRHSPSPTSKSQLPSRRATINGAPTDNYAIESAPRSGSRRLKPIGFGLSSCGNQSTNRSVGGVLEPAHLSTSSRSTTSSWKRSARCRLLRAVRPRRCSLQFATACHSHSSPPSASMTSSVQLANRWTRVGDRAFPVAADGAKLWNGLPSDMTSASSLAVFKNRLKTYLFRRCYETV